MLPEDTLPEDRPMYYRNTWMKHPTLGPVIVDNVAGNSAAVSVPLNVGGEIDVDMVDITDLRVWFPQAGAYNYNDTVIWISKHNQRSTRKSACPNVYRVTNPISLQPLITAPTLVWLLKSNPRYTTAEDARRLIFEEGYRGRALSRKVYISAMTRGTPVLYYMNRVVGTYNKDGTVTPTMPVQGRLYQRIRSFLLSLGVYVNE